VGGFLLRRAALSILTLGLFATLVFFLVQAVMPGDFIDSLGPGVPAEERQQIVQELGLDRPLWGQYLEWIGGAVRGDLGLAFGPNQSSQVPVSDVLRLALPNSLLAFTLAVGAAFLVGTRLGRASAWRRNTWFRGVTTATSVGFYTSFPPWLAFAATYLVVTLIGPATYDRLRTVDPVIAGRADIPSIFQGGRLLWFMVLTAVIAFLTVPLVGRAWRALTRRRLPLLVALAWLALTQVAAWALAGAGALAGEVAAAQLIPLSLLFLLFFGEVVILTQAAMAAARREDYVLTARAKGLPDREVRDRHAARPALLPVLSRFVVSLPYFLTAMVITERAIGYPGLGSVLFEALDTEDVYVVMGALLVIGLITVLARLSLDVMLAVLDPRIRFGGTQVGR
jgi:peptide/nickel transport system permease protein